MKDSEILRKAAELINPDFNNDTIMSDRNGYQFCCHALARAQDIELDDYSRVEFSSSYELFEGLFRYTNFGCVWFRSNNYDTTAQMQNHRIMALLFAAEIAESEGN